ncbi:MAG: hypothetical protein HKN76_09810 [Saprospiraceae bacterium]|nr:hypothetical protein [Saprospiraceae bacterium]
MKFHIYITIVVGTISVMCQNPKRVLPSMEQKAVSDQDLPYQDMFKPLDGIWSGTFRIYENPSGQEILGDRDGPIVLDSNQIKTFDLISAIQVRQKYQSLTPYYQTVEIRDTYHGDGDTTLVESFGVNKIENGRIWCIVKKPDEQIIHEGSWEAPHTIIWTRWEKQPLKKEYFRETVMENTYTILGYGYYGSDDPELAPKTWFIGNYARLSDYFR